MENLKPIYKSRIDFFGTSLYLVLFFTFLYTLFLMAFGGSTLDKICIFQIIIISLVYSFVIWLLIATEVRYIYIYDDRVEIHHPFYHKRFKWEIIYNQDIMKIQFTGTTGMDKPEIFIVKKKRRSFFGLKRRGFNVFKIEEKKTVLNHFYRLNIPIKIYSEAEENQHLIDK